MHHHFDVANDAALPLLWTSTRGNIIPPHAVPLHEGPHGQLYVARGVVWGEMHVGTACCASTEGAHLYDSHGQSHIAFEYEVLTCATGLRFHLEDAADTAKPSPRLPVRRESVTARRTAPRASRTLAPFPWLTPEPAQPHEIDPPPYTSPKGGWVEVPKHAYPHNLSNREIVQFGHLAHSKCFVVIDDTASMQYSWAQTRAALSGVVDNLSSNSQWGGLNVRFLYHEDARPCVKTREEFESVFNSVALQRCAKVVAAKLNQMFEESVSLICDPCNPRPVNLLIITDGMPTDAQELLDTVLDICRQLKEKSVPPQMFRIHLLQMGEDRTAVKPLHDFRDRVLERGHDKNVLNVVSFHRGRGPLDAQKILKFLLASTHIPADEDPELGERQPSEVIAAQCDELERIRTMASGRR